MAFRLQSVQLGSPRRRGEGIRLGTVRYLPRGVKKQDYARLNHFDVWLPMLAPSRELLQQFRNEQLSAAAFLRKYRREMQGTETRQLVRFLGKLAETTPLSIGCYCEDETRCHRSALYQLIREASGRRSH